MNSPRLSFAHHQRGATLIVGLIMLVLITLMVTSAFMLSNSNLKAVGNMQFRDEAISAANSAIEEVISSGFTTAPAGRTIDKDIDHDGRPDYRVTIAAPVCIRMVKKAGTGGTGTGSSATLNLSTSLDYYHTVWDIDATVSSNNATGAAIHLRQGVRVLLDQSQCNAACPPSPGTACS